MGSIVFGSVVLSVSQSVGLCGGKDQDIKFQLAVLGNSKVIGEHLIYLFFRFSAPNGVSRSRKLTR